MVNSLEEIQSVAGILQEIRSELETRSFKPLPQIPLGIMLETPAALEMTNVFSKDAAFFCIGSNDLAQLNLAADREKSLSNEELFYHPAFFRQLKRILDLSTVPVSLCGALSSQLELLPLLLGLGLRSLSVPLSLVVSCAKVLERSKYSECQALAQKALQAPSAAEIRKLLSSPP